MKIIFGLGTCTVPVEDKSTPNTILIIRYQKYLKTGMHSSSTGGESVRWISNLCLVRGGCIPSRRRATDVRENTCIILDQYE